jgi:GNAT superfamily N-acetyltransferase
MPGRVATESDLDGLTATLAGAFAEDPVWSWAGLDDLETFWRFLVGSALRYPWSFTTGDYDAVAIWIPPGGSELTESEEDQVDGLMERLAGPRAPELLEFLERFEHSHPKDPPHFYLSLLGTHPNRRGEGIGMGLLRECLALIDAEGAPAYLESTNPVNNPRYESVGFRAVGEFSTPDGSHTLTTMWRDSAG